MSAAGIKTTTPNVQSSAALQEDGMSNNAIANVIEIENANGEDEKASFCTLLSTGDLQLSICNEIKHNNNKVPVETCKNVRQQPENESENFTPTSNRDLNEIQRNRVRQGDGESQLSPGLSLLQETATATTSPPPHSYRHSRAYRHFKNPPQPHMCIRTTTEAGEELFINVLSWTRIVIPQEPSDPIPLYGGMRVPPGSPRSPPIVFAVMANPEVLKDSGRHSKDPEERRAMVELMCDFVEAMNPGVKLVRNAIILKDRDISGELKDVWNAVQAQRDREREEQMIIQRQQHFQNITNTSPHVSLIQSSSSACVNSNVTATTQHMGSKPMHIGIGNDGMSITVDDGNPPRSRKNSHEVQNDNNASNIDIEKDIEMSKTNNGQMSLPLLVEHLDSNMPMVADAKTVECKTKPQSNQNAALNNGNNSNNSIQAERTGKINNQLNAISCDLDLKKDQLTLANGSLAHCDAEVSNITKTFDTTITQNASTDLPTQNPPTNNTSNPIAQQVPTKKEKLAGFLPNGCIFPRFTKNNKHKEKDKDKDKEPKIKDKEKNVLLSALKKSKDKKLNAATAANSDEKNTSSNSKTTAANCNNSNIKQQKNCLQQLECEVQKLDINNHHFNHIVENNINNSAAIIATNNTVETNKNTSSTTNNSDGVGVY